MRKIYLLMLSGVLCSSVALAQKFVTQDGAGNKDGANWANAYDASQLQAAINAADAETDPTQKQVWVAKGIYKPTESLSSTGFLTDGTTSVTNRDKTFILKAGVEIYGGFSGGEISINDRVNISTTNQTILSGDLNNNNIADDGDSYHVVSSRNASLGAILDGFTIQHGYANGASTITEGGEAIDQNSGAAISLRGENTAMKFANLLIKDNESTALSGGVYLRGADENRQYDFNKVTFENNKGGGSGGAMYIYYTSLTTTVNITNCIFKNNTGGGTSGGGAIIKSNLAGTLNITDSKFTGNTHAYYGGAIRNGVGTTTIVGCEFEENSSQRGAIYTTGSSTLKIENCKFNKNSATVSGGQIYVYSGTANIYKSVFTNGVATTNGGAIYIQSSSEAAVISNVYIGNCMFYNNVATLGGAIYLTNGTFNSVNNTSSLTTVNNTFYSNKCTGGTSTNDSGGAIYFVSSSASTLNIYNSIFNGNLYGYDAVNKTGGTPSDFRRGQTGSYQNYYYNLIQAAANTNSGNRYSIGNINNATPTLLFASTTETDYNFLWPILGGVSVDAGTDKDKDNNNLYANIAIEKDLLGHNRLIGTKIDLGAIEYSSVLPVKVSSFTTSLVNNRTQLKWSVGTEDNVNRYEVERSQNGVDFVKVAAIIANGSASYQATDNSPQTGDNYYRLITIDNDGSRSQYGTINVVKVGSLVLQNVQVYPNPVKGNEIKITLASPAGTYGYKVVSTSGSVVQQGSISYNGSSAVTNLSPAVVGGVYVLHFSNGTQAKLIKQ